MILHDYGKWTQFLQSFYLTDTQASKTSYWTAGHVPFNQFPNTRIWWAVVYYINGKPSSKWVSKPDENWVATYL